MNFQEKLDSYDFSKNELINALFQWSYNKDKRLYLNLDDHFSAHTYRNLVSEETKTGLLLGTNTPINVLVETEDFDALKVMELALSKCDYHDSRRFAWAFSEGGSNRKEEYKFKSNEMHPYSSILDLVKTHEEKLKHNGLASFRKSADVEKNRWYRSRIQTYLEMDRYNNSGEFLLTYPGNNIVSHVFSMEIYKEYLQYILDNNIVSDPHTKEIMYRPFGFNDYRGNNGYRINTLMDPIGGIIYLTASEILEIYKKIPKHKVPVVDKPEWAFIQSLCKNNWEDVKFYINLEKE